MHQFIYRFHRSILILTALLTIIAIILAGRLKLDLDLFALLPSDNPGVNTFFEITEEIGLQSLLITLVEMPPEFDQGKAEYLVDLLAKNFSRSPLIHDVQYKNGGGQISNVFHVLMEYLPLLLNSRDLKRLAFLLSDPEINSRVSENKRLLMTPFGIAAKEMVYVDPLSLRDLLRPDALSRSGKRSARASEGYFKAREGGTYFLFLKPKSPPQDVEFSKKLMAETRRLEKNSLSEFHNQFGYLPEKIKISFTGGYPIAVNDEAATKKDMKITLLTSFLGVMILFGLSFRTFSILFYVGLPLALSILWTLGFASLAFHHLNILTCIFSCVLIGLGIDFAIHIVNRYFDQDNVSLDVLPRLEKTFRQAGMGIIIGGITTAAAFYSIGISSFKGFRELAFLTGTGILFCMIVMILVLPSIFLWFSGGKGPKHKVSIAGFGLKPLLNSLRKYPRSLLAVSSIAICVLAALGISVKFDDNLKNFRPTGNEVFLLQDKVTAWLGGSTGKIFLVATDKSEVGVMETSASIYEALQEMKESGMVAGINSVSKYFRAPSLQKKNMEFILQHPDVFEIKRIQRTFNEALAENGFERLDLYDEYFGSLSKAFSTEKILLPGLLNETELESFLKPFVYQKGGYFKTVTYITPNKDLWSHTDTALFKEMIARKMEERGIKGDCFQLTGSSILTGDLKELIINNMKSSLWVAGLIIMLVLLVYYRNLKLFILSTIPLAVALASICGIMVIFGLDFNFFNLIVLPMIAGIGIDDGVHLTNTYRRRDQGNMLEEMTKTGRAAVLTSLTTLVGFGSLSLSHYPGLRSIGYVAVIGISACLFASIIVLPAIFSIMRHSR